MVTAYTAMSMQNGTKNLKKYLALPTKVEDSLYTPGNIYKSVVARAGNW